MPDLGWGQVLDDKERDGVRVSAQRQRQRQRRIKLKKKKTAWSYAFQSIDFPPLDSFSIQPPLKSA